MSTAHPAPEQVVLETREGAALTITLNRPDRLNAMNTQMMTDLRDLFETILARVPPAAGSRSRSPMTASLPQRGHSAVEPSAVSQSATAVGSSPVQAVISSGGNTSMQKKQPHSVLASICGR